MGIISALGSGPACHLRALKSGQKGLRPLSLFTVPPDALFPVGEVPTIHSSDILPRTHQLACSAADQAMSGRREPPDAIVLGVTTGGMQITEDLLAKKVHSPEAFRNHAVNSVTEELARRYGCCGPLITISTACSSGAAAIKLAVDMLRCGMARRVLAGGADGLCRLTYFGFHSLQLLDPAGSRPLDLERRGMSIADGAAMLLLSTEAVDASGICILGGGFSCDAHHPSAPHPEGQGAFAAMRAALADAGVSPGDIDYVNLHGTGTFENDRSEALAVNRLFDRKPPAVSSIKGSVGHSLAASGAIEAVVTALCAEHGVVPANVGVNTVDSDLNLTPAIEPIDRPVNTALSNSFGFGGNNAALVIGKARRSVSQKTEKPFRAVAPLMVKGLSCLSGAGWTEETASAMLSGEACSGCSADERLTAGFPSRAIRRLKRLPKMALALAREAMTACPAGYRPSAVSFGTGWGAMTETHHFLTRLFETELQFPSPADFIGSVHNAPAGQIAMMYQATGANITVSGGDCSFEQALLTADLQTRNESRSILLVAADEAHPVLSPLFDLSVGGANRLSDGGGAFCLERPRDMAGVAGVSMDLAYYRLADASGSVDHLIEHLIEHLGGAACVNATYGMVMAGVPAAQRPRANEQLAQFLARCRFDGPVVDYRRQTGEFATASAVAAAVSVKLLEQNGWPSLGGKGILLLGLGAYLSAIRLLKS
jgi:3-oxoacyl-(acyl-carrier-protein) synthase